MAHRAVGSTVALLLLLGRSAAAGETLFVDKFEGLGRPAGWLTYNAPSERFWTAYDGELLTGNGDEITAEGGYTYAVVSASGADRWTNYTVSADVWMSQRNGRIGLVGYWRSPQEHIEGSIEFGEGRRTARIIRASLGLVGAVPQREVLAEGEAQAAGLPIPPMEGGMSARDAHRLSLSLKDSEVVLMIDGQLLLRAENTQVKAGSAGLLNLRNFAYYDNFRVEGVEEKAPPAPPAPTLPPSLAPAPRPSLREAPLAAPPAASMETGAASPPSSAEMERPVARGNVALPNFRQEVPLGVVKNIDWDELVKRLTKEEQAAYRTMSADDRINLLNTIAVELRRAANPEDSQLGAELGKMKRQLEKLTSDQQKMAESLSQKALEDRSVADGFQEIDKAVDRRDYTAALGKVNELIQRYPNNVSLTARKKQLERLSAGTYEGYDEALAKNETRYKELQARAAQMTGKGDLQGAQAAWITVKALSPSRPEWIDQAETSLGTLSDRVTADVADLRSFRSGFNRDKLATFAAAGAAILLSVAVLLVLRRHARRVRARDQEILAQVKDLTRPIMDMQEEIRQLTGATALALPDAPNRSTNATTAIAPPAKARKEKRSPPQPAPEPVLAEPEAVLAEAAPSDSFPDIFGGDEDLLSSGPTTQLDTAEAGLGLAAEPASAGGGQPQSPSMDFLDSGLDFSLEQGLEDFLGPAAGEKAPAAPPAPPAEPQRPALAGARGRTEKKTEEPALPVAEDLSGPLDLGLDDLIAAGPSDTETTGIPTAQFVAEPSGAAETQPEPQKEPSIARAGAGAPGNAPSEETKPSAEEDLFRFAFDFAEDSQTKTEISAPAPQRPQDEAPPLAEVEPPPLTFDFPDLEPVNEETSVPEAPAAGLDAPAVPVMEAGPDEDTTRIVFGRAEAETGEAPGEGGEEAEDAGAQTATAMGVVLEQGFDDEAAGQTPKQWSGVKKNGVEFEISDAAGAPHSSRCLRYLKSTGVDSVYFSRRFPRVSGIVGVEFDICCPRKNKYLLGVYVERDGNYNQAVRTVVHCIDPSSASLRMQNEPAPYKLGDWRHIRYEIDLYEGKIDGYLDGQKVLDQHVFVNKPPFVNTISIRDNHATTGELLLDNIKVEKLG